MNARPYLLGSLLLVAACGDNGTSTKCGANTTLTNGECVADGGPTCGANTTLMGGMCVATTGPTCGLGTVLSGGHCVADTSAPGPVTGLTATVNGASIDLAWTAGSSSTATLVARLVAGADDQPAANTAYAVGDTLPGGAKVIAVGAPTTFADAFTTPGRYSYRAWSINASGNYGLGREVAALAAIPAQTGAVSLDLTAATATVTTQPANVAIALANLTFTTDHATVDVTLTNNTAGPLYSPRIVLSGLSIGTFAAPSTTAAGDGFVIPTYGGLLPGAPVTTTIEIDGLLVTDTVTANLAVEESGLAIVGGNAVATLGGGAATLQIPSVRGNRQSSTLFTDGAFAPSGRYFYGVTRWTSGLSRVDTATGVSTTVAAFPELLGSGYCVGVTDGTAYIGFTLGGHRRNGGHAIGVAEVDLASMTVLRSTSLELGNGGNASGACAFHGTHVALGAGSAVYLFDTTAMTFVDTVPGTVDVIDGVDTGLGTVRTIAYDPAGTSVYATDKSTTIVKIDPAFAVTTYHTSSSSAPMHDLTVDAAGTLWWTANNGLFSFDGTTQATVPNFTTKLRGIVALTSTTATVFSNSSLFTLDLTTGAISGTTAFDNTNRIGHTIRVFQ